LAGAFAFHRHDATAVMSLAALPVAPALVTVFANNRLPDRQRRAPMIDGQQPGYRAGIMSGDYAG